MSLEQKFKQSARYDQQQLLRELIQLAQEIEARLEAIEARLDAGGL